MMEKQLAGSQSKTQTNIKHGQGLPEANNFFRPDRSCVLKLESDSNIY